MAAKERAKGSGGARAGSGRKPHGYIAVELAERVSDDELQELARNMMARMVHAVTQAMPKLILDEIEDAQRGDKKARERLLDRFLGKPKESIVVEPHKGAETLQRLMEALLTSDDSDGAAANSRAGRQNPKGADGA